MGSGFSKKKGRTSRKPKYQNAGVRNDSTRHSIGDQTDFRADSSDDDDDANPRNNQNYGVHANPNTNTERTDSFGIQANSSDDDDDVDDEEDREPSFPQGYTSAEKEKGIAIDEPPQNEPPQNYGGNYYEPPQNYGGNYYVPPQNYGGNYYEPPQNYGGNYYEPPQNYGGNYYEPPQNEPPQNYGGNFYEPLQNWAWTGYHDNNYGSYCYDHNMNHQSSMVRALDDPLNYERQSHGQNEGVSWGESFAKDAADQFFGGVDPYSKVGRY